jgi:hypothetical protein
MSSILLRLIGCAGAGALLLAGAAQAAPLAGSGFKPVVGLAKGAAPAGAPPPGLPGAGTSSNVAPPTRSPTDMPPTDALFDAIDRGDLAVARDALNRGADLNGHNLLGMTPMELSVDLGRNDITFLLLSLRNAGGDAGAASATGRASVVAGGKPTAGKSEAAKPREVAQRKPELVPRRVAVEQAQSASGAPYPTTGGTPEPQVGFLGFTPGTVR